MKRIVLVLVLGFGLSACGMLQGPIDKRPAVISITRLHITAAKMVAECYASAGVISASTNNPQVAREIAEIYGVCEFEQQSVDKLSQILAIINEADSETDKAEIIAVINVLGPKMVKALEAARRYMQQRIEAALEYLDQTAPTGADGTPVTL